MPLLDLSGEIADRWQRPGDGPLPDGPVILPPERLGEAGDRETGLHLAADADLASVEPHFPGLALISVEFPSFADGRGFSIGRRLRAMGFEGTLRAYGPVIADQFAYLLACGFDEVEIPDSVAGRQPPEQWLAARRLISAGYQRGLGDGRSILDARLGR